MARHRPRRDGSNSVPLSPVSEAEFNNTSLTLVQTIVLICVSITILAILIWSRANAGESTLIISPESVVLEDAASFNCKVVAPVQLQRTGELETRAALERLFGKPFKKVRPPWIINPESGRRLELDAYNEELRLGVEHDGVQHSIFPNPFHRTVAEFEAQQRRDAYKSKACLDRGVCLLRVPHTLPRAEIQTFLSNELQNRGFNVGHA